MKVSEAKKITGGLSANTISPQAQLVVEARFTGNDEKRRILAAFEHLPKHNPVADSFLTVTGGLQRDVMQSCAKQQQLLRQIEEILGYPLNVEKRGGVSDANVTAPSRVLPCRPRPPPPPPQAQQPSRSLSPSAAALGRGGRAAVC